MSPESYGWETIEAAEELYILDGCTFDQVAQRTGVSISQLKRWSAEATPSWPERRREYRQAQVSVRRGVMLAKAKLIESVIAEEDPQKAYAFSSLVGSGQVIEQEARQRIAPTQPGGLDDAETRIQTPQEAVEALQDAVQRKLAAILSRPGELSFAAIKDTKAALEMIEQLKSKYTPEDEPVRKGGLSDEAAKAIRRQILGLGT